MHGVKRGAEGGRVSAQTHLIAKDTWVPSQVAGAGKTQATVFSYACFLHSAESRCPVISYLAVSVAAGLPSST
jgi:hypothetical protein